MRPPNLNGAADAGKRVLDLRIDGGHFSQFRDHESAIEA
jgi:hypothetical protein